VDALVRVDRQGVQQTGIVGSSLMFVRDGAVAGSALEGYHIHRPCRSGYIVSSARPMTMPNSSSGPV